MKKTNWTRLFWSSHRDGDELSDADLAALAEEAADRGETAAPEPQPQPQPQPALGDPALFAADFPALYARSNIASDPKVDQVLVAFESMKAAMPAAQLAIAIRATAKAIDADPVLVARALQKRALALDASIADAHRTVSEREATRTSELATATTKVRAEIDELERTITARREQLAAVTERLHRTTAEEKAAAATFETRAREEATRLVALRDVLGPTSK